MKYVLRRARGLPLPKLGAAVVVGGMLVTGLVFEFQALRTQYMDTTSQTTRAMPSSAAAVKSKDVAGAATLAVISKSTDPDKPAATPSNAPKPSRVTTASSSLVSNPTPQPSPPVCTISVGAPVTMGDAPGIIGAQDVTIPAGCTATLGLHTDDGSDVTWELVSGEAQVAGGVHTGDSFSYGIDASAPGGQYQYVFHVTDDSRGLNMLFAVSITVL